MRPWFVMTLTLASCAGTHPAVNGWVSGSDDARVSAVWIGHATVLVELAGVRILTDPNLGSHLFVLPRETPASVNASELPPVDVAVVSHLHFDHYDRETLARLPASVRVVFPGDAEPYTRNLPQSRAYLGAWESAQVGGVRITAVPVAHFGGRYGPDALWNRSYAGYVLESRDAVVYFGGDSGLDEDQMKEVARRWPNIDLALLPIAPYRGDSGNSVHMDPAEALSAFDLLNARYMIPIHYEAYYGFFGRFALPRRKLTGVAEERGISKKVFALQVGQRWELPRRGVPKVFGEIAQLPEASESSE